MLPWMLAQSFPSSDEATWYTGCLNSWPTRRFVEERLLISFSSAWQDERKVTDAGNFDLDWGHWFVVTINGRATRPLADRL